MKKEIITCDLCGQENKSGETIWHTICIVVREGAQNNFLSGIGMFPLRSADWCEDCCKKMQVLPVPKEKTAPPEPTLEELIRAIVQDEVGNSR